MTASVEPRKIVTYYAVLWACYLLRSVVAISGLMLAGILLGLAGWRLLVCAVVFYLLQMYGAKETQSIMRILEGRRET